MRKLIAFLCVGVIAFSLTACGGSSKKEEAVPASTVTDTPVVTETPKPPEPAPEPKKPEEPESSPNDEVKKEILEHVDVAYTGLTSVGAPMYFLASSDGEYAAIVLENTDNKRYIKFDGGAVIDDDTGIMTITDTDKGHTFSFTAEKQSDGSFYLDCGNLGECYLEPDEPGNVVDSIILTLQNKIDATDELVEALAAESTSIAESIDIAFSGITEAGGSMYYLASNDGSFAALIVENAQETGYIKFVGSTTIAEDGRQLVTDSEKNYTFAFIAEELEDGSYFLDCGELGECYVESDVPEDVLSYIEITFEDMEDLTDAFMDEYGH